MTRQPVVMGCCPAQQGFHDSSMYIYQGPARNPSTGIMKQSIRTCLDLTLCWQGRIEVNRIRICMVSSPCRTPQAHHEGMALWQMGWASSSLENEY